MKDYDFNKLKQLRELEYELTGSHTAAMYEKASHRKRKQEIESLLLKYRNGLEGQNVLDYGCAEGIYCEILLNGGYTNVFGVDIAENKIAAAREKYGEGQAKFLTFEEFKVREDLKFKLILCLEVLQHIPDYKKVIELLYVRLEEGGYILISIPNLSKSSTHENADVNNQMSVKELMDEVGGGGFGKQNAFWRFNSHLFYTEMKAEFKTVEIVEVDTPDGQVKNLWTLGLLQKR